MSNSRKPVGSVVFAPSPGAPVIPVVDDIPKAMQAAEDQDAGFADFGKIISAASVTERATETKTFELKGKPYKFEIYTDGREDAELWSRLITAAMHGHLLEARDKMSGKAFAGEQVSVPVGPAGSGGIKQFAVTDPGYLGSVKVLSLCLKRPAWSMQECLIMGHELGRGFNDVIEWVMETNGLNEEAFRQLSEFEKKMKMQAASGK